MNDDDEKDLLYRHSLSYLIGLSLLTDFPRGLTIESSPGQRRMMLSATLFAFRGRVALATAGHIFEQIKSIINEGYTVQLSLVDMWAQGAKVSTPVPLPYNIDDCWHMDTDGVDLAFLPLTKNTFDLLDTNGVKLIDEHHWSVKPSDDRFGICATLGLPTDSFSVSVSSGIAHINASPTLVRIDHKFKPPDFIQEHAKAYWYGRVETSEVESLPFNLNGLSGGPVFGFERLNSETIKLYVIGWQFGVKEHDGHTYFCVTPAYLIGQWVEESFKEPSD